MKKQLILLVGLLGHIVAIGQIKTNEVEIRTPTGSWVNAVTGSTIFSGTYVDSDPPTNFVNIVPTQNISSAGTFSNNRSGLRVNLLHTFHIPEGAQDNGFRNGLDISAYVDDADLQGILGTLRGARINFGTHSNSSGGRINEVIGLYLNGLKSDNVEIGSAYGIYQAGDIYRNYFQGNMKIFNDLDNSQRLDIDLKDASNNRAISLKASAIGSDSYWIRAESDEDIDAFVVRGDGRVGIGTTSPAGNLHIRRSTVSGGVSGNYDNLILEENGNVGLTLMSPDANNAGIAFANAEDSGIGRIMYRHNTDRMSFIVNNGERVSIVNKNLGVGTTDPKAKLHLRNSIVPGGAIHQNFDNIVIEQYSGNSGITFLSRDNTNAGIAFADNDGQNSGVINYLHNYDAMVFNTNGSERVRVVDNGNVGIGTNSPSKKLDVNGEVKANEFDASSDRRWKKDISIISNAQETLNDIRPVSYQWRVDEFPNKGFDDELHYGVIAQELEKVLPELVSTDNEGYKSVDYLGMIGLLVKGFHERGEEIARLKQELENKDLDLEARLAKIEKALSIKSTQQITEKSTQ